MVARKQVLRRRIDRNVVPWPGVLEAADTNNVDEALCGAERRLVPLLHKYSAAGLAAIFSDAVSTHLAPELEFIKNGKSDGCIGRHQQEMRKAYLREKRGR